MRIFSIPAALLLVVAIGSPAQDTLKVTTNLVNVAFVARDPAGALVGNLEKEDLEVFEDAVPQKISFFSHSTDIPLTLGIIVDFSDSQQHFYARHRNDLELFLRETMSPADRVFLVCFGNRISLVSDFTNSAADLLERLQGCEKHKHSYPQLGPPEERILGTAFYDAIYYSIVDKLGGENGRRALLLFSDGEDNSSSHDMMSTIEAAQNANVIVYCIRYTDSPHGQLNARNQYGIRVMDRVAKESGGRHFDANALDPHDYLEQIAAELRTSYELAYYPQRTLNDQPFRKIVVQARRHGLTIRSRTGYFPR